MPNIRRLTCRAVALALAPAFSLALSHAALAAPPNPPPANKLQGYSGYELKALTVDATVGEKKNLDKVVAKVEESLHHNVDPILQSWNAQASAGNPQKLVIEPHLTSVHKPSGASRFFAGAMAGDGYITVKVSITEQPSGKLIAEPEFYRRASAMAGAWTVGAHDNAMLEKVAALAANYLSANYSEAVGGDTGHEP
jgi:uncharacterized protein DUF4410